MHVFRVTQAANDAKFVGPNPREDGRSVLVRSDLRRETVSEHAFAEQVRADVIALLNTVRLDAALPLDETPNVARSVLNHGFIDLLNRTYDDNRMHEIAAEIERVLTRYEPRLSAVAARFDKPKDTQAQHKARFVVHATLKSNPVDLPIEFVAEIDVGAGKIRVDAH
jgi:type VI secretion system protein ImpF